MHHKPDLKKLIPPRLAEKLGDRARLAVPLVLLLALGLILGGYLLLKALVGTEEGFSVSGTIEAVEIHLGTEIGGRVDRVYAAEGETVYEGQVVAVVRGEKIKAPLQGVVLERVAEPGEVVGAGATLVTLSDLEALTLTVYVPEDRYGRILLGQDCPVTVDSFPGRTFSGRVSHIADQAEYTPRNVQTTDSRKNTVFAIKISLAPSGGLLKPGMPADVRFENGSAR